MATVTKSRLGQRNIQAGVPFGNAYRGQHTLVTAAGVMVDGNQATALQIADVVRLGVIPAGTTIHDAQIIISAAFTALTTAGVGFAYVDGVDSAAVPQDAAYFVAATGLALAAVGVSRKTTTKAPITLPKDAYVTLTLAGAAQAGAGIIDVIVEGIQTGKV